MGRGGRSVATIESPANPTVRMLRELHTHEGRIEHGAFLIEGVRLVAEALATSWSLLAVLYDPERARADSQLASLVAAIPGSMPASPRAIRHASDTVTPQGIVAAARMPTFSGAIDPTEPLVLVMDGIADPGNAGTMLRSALASGVRTVLATRGSVDLFAPKVVRSGMGAHFRLNLATELGWPRISELLGPGRALVVAQARASLAYYRYNWLDRAALIVGSEAHGPSTDSLQQATAHVAIPLEAGVESLNAAVAASVILFEAKRQREVSSTVVSSE